MKPLIRSFLLEEAWAAGGYASHPLLFVWFSLFVSRFWLQFRKQMFNLLFLELVISIIKSSERIREGLQPTSWIKLCLCVGNVFPSDYFNYHLECLYHLFSIYILTTWLHLRKLQRFLNDFFQVKFQLHICSQWIFMNQVQVLNVWQTKLVNGSALPHQQLNPKISVALI